MRSDALLNTLQENLKAYKRKYYLNQLLKGSIFFLTLLSSTYLFFTVLEYYGKFNPTVRVVFFFTYVTVGGLAFYKWIADPLSKIFALRKQLSDEEASVQIGNYFPEIKDKLLNTIQLSKNTREENDLIAASIAQKTKSLSIVPFVNAINLKENRRYVVRYLLSPVAFILLILMFIPDILVEGTTRILYYNKEFNYPLPFNFILKNESLNTIKNEDFEIQALTEGEVVPENMYLVSEDGRRVKMQKSSTGNFAYTYRSIQKSEKFYFEAGGFSSRMYEIKVLSKPDLRSFETHLTYPAYLNKRPEILRNPGNLTIPEGTTVSWEFNAADTDKLKITFPEKTFEILKTNNNFRFSRRSLKSESYFVDLENKEVASKEKIEYSINVIPDQFPIINAESYEDTILYRYVSIGGNIVDDYGLTRLKLFYKKVNKNNPEQKSEYSMLPLGIDGRLLNQNFIFNWNLDSLKIQPGEKLEYFVQVWDNDGVNGNKSSRTKVFVLNMPDKDALAKEMNESSNQAENKMQQAMAKADRIQKEINKIQEKLKGKNNLNWQDKKNLEDLLKKHDDLRKDLEELKKLNEQLNQKQDKFNQPSSELKEKMEQLQKLMDELLDEETKKLYEELQKLLNENANKNELQKILDKLEKKEFNLEKELERSLEMFKQLKFDAKLNEAIKDLKELSKEQEKLAEKTMEKKESADKLEQEQQKIQEEFNKIQEKLNDLEKLNESLENKNQMEKTDSDEQEISKEMQNSSEQLKNNNNKKAGNSQKNAAKKMDEMAEKLSAMQQSNEMQEAQENIDDLRAILENLIHLSFEQEELMKEFRKINQTDPRFVTLSQKQLKLKDDSKVIEDSLMALAKRVFQIESFVTRELGQMKGFMDESVKALKDRRPELASGKQQFAMTSMNNLALMLNDALKQMMEQMQQQQANQKGGKNMCKKPGSNPKPGLGQLQQQLNDRIQQLKQSGKSGKELSEELGKLAAEQEALRKALKEMEQMLNKDGGKNPGSNLSKLKEMMEQTETDLVNKRITQETLMRQQEILTRLLESEKAVRERDLDDKREAESAKEQQRELPPSFEKYLRQKEKQVDLLKTVPPSLTPYYKEEVNEYFQKIEK